MKLPKYQEQLMNEFEQKMIGWTYIDLENRLKQIKPGSSYHDVKPMIIKAHKIGLWPRTIRNYLETNAKSHMGVSSEFSRIAQELGI